MVIFKSMYFKNILDFGGKKTPNLKKTNKNSPNDTLFLNNTNNNKELLPLLQKKTKTVFKFYITKLYVKLDVAF